VAQRRRGDLLLVVEEWRVREEMTARQSDLPLASCCHALLTQLPRRLSLRREGVYFSISFFLQRHFASPVGEDARDAE
jgi:hypothetical protein